MDNKIAVLLINLGSPEEPNKKALKKYLREFLSDKRVIDLNRFLWLPILHLIILNTRPQKSALLYQKIWDYENNQSPLIQITQKQVKALQLRNPNLHFDYAMRYGKPSIKSKIQELKNQGFSKILFIPMYPQYSEATTASVLDEVMDFFKNDRNIPQWFFVRDWHDNPLYINALADSYKKNQEKFKGAEKLLLSFHGIPKRFVALGDEYEKQVLKTAQLFREKLALTEDFCEVVFQSHFGYEEWLKPYCDERILQLAQEGVKNIAILCAGFSADCLETLEEIAIRNKKVFLDNGGENYFYIPALNDSEGQILLFENLIKQFL